MVIKVQKYVIFEMFWNVCFFAGAVNIFGRISAGCLANVQRIDALWLCNVGMLMCGIGCALLPLCTTFTSLCLFAVYVGYFIGMDI